MGRAKKAIEALAKLAPETATVRRDGQTSEIPVEQMVVGDVAIVRPNERLPADGFVITGTSAINQAPVTGESIPVDKVPVADAAAARAKPAAVDAESRVFAGTINGGGARVRQHGHQRDEPGPWDGGKHPGGQGAGRGCRRGAGKA